MKEFANSPWCYDGPIELLVMGTRKRGGLTLIKRGWIRKSNSNSPWCYDRPIELLVMGTRREDGKGDSTPTPHGVMTDQMSS